MMEKTLFQSMDIVPNFLIISIAQLIYHLFCDSIPQCLSCRYLWCLKKYAYIYIYISWKEYYKWITEILNDLMAILDLHVFLFPLVC